MQEVDTKATSEGVTECIEKKYTSMSVTEHTRETNTYSEHKEKGNTGTSEISTKEGEPEGAYAISEEEIIYPLDYIQDALSNTTFLEPPYVPTSVLNLPDLTQLPELPETLSTHEEDARLDVLIDNLPDVPKFNPARIHTDKELDELELRYQKLVKKGNATEEEDFDDLER